MATGIDLYLGANPEVVANGGLLRVSAWLHDLGKSDPAILSATRSATNFRTDRAISDMLRATIDPHPAIGAGIAEANGVCREACSLIGGHHSPPTTIEGAILQAFDRFDAISTLDRPETARASPRTSPDIHAHAEDQPPTDATRTALRWIPPFCQ